MSPDKLNYLKNQIVNIINQVLSEWKGDDKEVELKSDGTPVTEIDTKISKLIKENFSNYTFYSEEEHDSLIVNPISPPIIVLDPIDGTEELISGNGECVVSLFAMKSYDSKEQFAWIFNPFTGFSLSSLDSAIAENSPRQTAPFLGFVSRSEWRKGLYKNYNDSSLRLVPRGSIAFKLALLASNACDFVISLQGKNVWDIAAGTQLCRERGLYFFEGDREVHTLDKKRYDPPLVWAKSKEIRDFIVKNIHTS